MPQVQLNYGISVLRERTAGHRFPKTAFPWSPCIIPTAKDLIGSVFLSPFRPQLGSNRVYQLTTTVQHHIKGGYFLKDDIAAFDAGFFGLSAESCSVRDLSGFPSWEMKVAQTERIIGLGSSVEILNGIRLRSSRKWCVFRRFARFCSRTKD